MRGVSLKDVCGIKNGYAFKSSEFKDSGTPLIRISSFNNGPVYFDDRTVYVENEYLESKSTFKVEKGDVLIALSGATTGKYGLYTHDKPSLLNQRVGLLKSGVSKDLDDKYFYFYLSVLQAEIFRKAGGAAQPNISTKEISDFKIPLPPLDQQKKIAAILDAADAYRQKTKALIEKYDELTQSLFMDMFGDPVTNPKGFNEVTVGEVVDLITYGLTVRPEYHSKGIPLISAREIRSGKVDLSIAPKISVEDFENLSLKGKPLKGDILFSKTGSIGHCAIVEEDTLFAVTQNAARIVFNETINRTYAIYFLRTPFIQTLSQSRAKGNAVKDLQLGEMKKFKFILPSVDFQNQFAERVQAIEEQKAQAEASLAGAEDLFNSLLQRAFNGELTS